MSPCGPLLELIHNHYFSYRKFWIGNECIANKTGHAEEVTQEVSTSQYYKPEILKQYAIQVEVSNYYNRLSLCNNIKLYLMSLIFAWYGHFHFDHFMMFENIIRQPKITFPN